MLSVLVLTYVGLDVVSFGLDLYGLVLMLLLWVFTRMSFSQGLQSRLRRNLAGQTSKASSGDAVNVSGSCCQSDSEADWRCGKCSSWSWRCTGAPQKHPCKKHVSLTSPTLRSICGMRSIKLPLQACPMTSKRQSNTTIDDTRQGNLGKKVWFSKQVLIKQPWGWQQQAHCEGV